MSQLSLTATLNQLLAIIGRSFLQYARYSRPYVPPGREGALETLESIAADQTILAERISQMIVDAGDSPRAGEFPMEYTNTGDLYVDYVVGLCIDYQRQDIAAIEVLVESLQLYPAAKSLAEEALGMAKGHLDLLKELQQETAPSA